MYTLNAHMLYVKYTSTKEVEVGIYFQIAQQRENIVLHIQKK